MLRSAAFTTKARWATAILVTILLLLPLITYPYWWAMSTEKDPNGTLRLWHDRHATLLVILQVIAFASFFVPLVCLVYLLILAIRRMMRKPVTTRILPLLLMPLILWPGYFRVPALVRAAAYPAMDKASRDIAQDLENFTVALREWQELHGSYPQDMNELRQHHPYLPARPPILPLPDYDFALHPNLDEVFVVYVRGALFWDSYSPLIYCPNGQCAEYGYKLLEEKRWYGDLLYSDHWRFPRERVRDKE